MITQMNTCLLLCYLVVAVRIICHTHASPTPNDWLEQEKDPIPTVLLQASCTAAFQLLFHICLLVPCHAPKCSSQISVPERYHDPAADRSNYACSLQYMQ